MTTSEVITRFTPLESGRLTFFLERRSERFPVSGIDRATPALREPSPYRPATLRILVADDNEASRVAVERLLQHDGHEIVVAGDGFDAAKAVFSRDFDLVLMDVEMPNLSGIEATRIIRALGGPYEALPIVALTAHTLLEELAQCRQAGMNGHVAKPVDGVSLRRTIANWAREIGTGMHAEEDRAASGTVIDTSQLLEVFEGDALAVAELLEAARAGIETDRARIETAAYADDAAVVRIAAHRLVGTSGSISGDRLTSISRLIESAARTGSMPVVRTHLEELGAAIAITIAAIDRFVRAAAGDAGTFS